MIVSGDDSLVSLDELKSFTKDFLLSHSVTDCESFLAWLTKEMWSRRCKWGKYDSVSLCFERAGIDEEVD